MQPSRDFSKASQSRSRPKIEESKLGAANNLEQQEPLNESDISIDFDGILSANYFAIGQKAQGESKQHVQLHGVKDVQHQMYIAPEQQDSMPYLNQEEAKDGIVGSQESEIYSLVQNMIKEKKLSVNGLEAQIEQNNILYSAAYNDKNRLAEVLMLEDNYMCAIAMNIQLDSYGLKADQVNCVEQALDRLKERCR